jgi:nicotinamidase-related amidase
MRSVSTLDFLHSVLISVDMQRGFDVEPWSRRWNTEVDANGQRLLAAWRSAGLPLIHVRHDSVEPASAFRPGQIGNEFRPGFEPRASEALLSKSVNSAFIATDLDLRLRRLGVKTVVVFGMSTDMCISTTIRVGANLGWRMVLIADACDCCDLPGHDGTIVTAREIHRAHVATLQHEFCDVVTTAQAIASIAQLHTLASA